MSRDESVAPVGFLQQVDAAASDFEKAFHGQEQPRIEDYLGRCSPVVRQNLFTELLRSEIELRQKTGQVPNQAEYLLRFPTWSEAVSAVFTELRNAKVDATLDPAMTQMQPVGHTASWIVSLEVVAGPHSGRRFEFSRYETFVVGRSTETQLALTDDPHFSRFHFRLEVNPPDVLLVDLGSRNGTFVNGTVQQNVPLRDGDVISGGATRIRVSIQRQRNTDEETLPLLSGGTAQHSPAKLSVPGYEIHEQVGRGAMGEVFRATQRATQRVVAMKIMIPTHMTNHDALRLFAREASLLGTLNHPRIVRFHEFGFAEQQFFLAMEFISVFDVEPALLKEQQAGGYSLACGLACQTLEALSYAHSQSLVHRDIKPSNILVTRIDGHLQVKLADFGLAKNFENAGFSSITGDFEARGTLAYMAPEQVLNCRFVKPSCDIYSVGATLYRFLAGASPFQGATDRMTFATILNNSPVPLDQRCPGLPRELVEVVHHALEREVANRFDSAESFRLALIPFAKRRKAAPK